MGVETIISLLVYLYILLRLMIGGPALYSALLKFKIL